MGSNTRIADSIYEGWGYSNDISGLSNAASSARAVEEAAQRAVNDPTGENWNKLVDAIRENGRQIAGTAGGLLLSPLASKATGDAVNAGGGLLQDQYGGSQQFADAMRNLKEAQREDFSNEIKQLIGQKAWDALKEATQDASTPPPDRIVDPLIIDLDGDGLETTAQSNVYFDNDGDGIANKMNWATADDGFLVIDKDANGKIESGAELFGDDFIKADGQFATDGFDALRSLDSNGDGQIDINDALYGQIKIWQDVNQNGVTDDGELRSLSDWGINAISLQQTITNELTQSGDQVLSTATVNWNDNRSGNIYDVNLNSSTVFTKFDHESDPTVESLALPDVVGMGGADDLRYAMDQNQVLRQLVTQFTSLSTAAEQKALIGQIIEQWALTYNGQAEFSPVTWQSWSQATVYDAELGRYVSRSFTSDYQLGENASTQIGVLSLFLGTTSYQHVTSSAATIGNIVANVQAVYADFEKSIYQVLVGQTRLAKYTDHITLGLDNGTLYDYSGLDTYLNNIDLTTADIPTLVEDLALLNNSDPFGFNLNGFELLKHLSTIIDEVGNNPELEKILAESGTSVTSFGLRYQSPSGIEIATVFDSFSDAITINSVNELIVFGGENNDNITVTAEKSVISGGLGNDIITSSGDSIIIGDEGNDILISDRGNNSYLFNLGDGQDTISDYNGTDKIIFGAGISKDNLSISYNGGDIVLTLLAADGSPTGDTITITNAFDTTNYRIETLEFSDGTSLSADEVLAAALTLIGTAGADTLIGTQYDDTINGLAGDDTISGGSGGNDLLYGGEGNDTLSTAGTGSNNLLDGGNGNDTLTGYYRAHNTLIGGDGDDILRLSSATDYYASSYSNTFNGGTGNDTITGGYSSDSYLFNLGDGQDTISDYNGTDKIIFGAGISKDNLSISRNGGDIVLTLLAADGSPTGDTITITNAFDTTNYRIETLEFSDGTSLSANEVHAAALILNGTAEADNIIGSQYGDTINGLAGDDTISGGSGSDTYIFSAGFGNDTLNNYDTNSASVDVARFGDTTIDELWLSRSDNDLLIDIAGTDNHVTISNWYSNSNYQLDQIQVGSSVLLNNQIDLLVSAMASFNSPSGVGNVIPQDVKEQLQPVLAVT